MPGLYTRLKSITHPSNKRARRRATAFMRRTPLTTTPRRQCEHRSLCRLSVGHIRDPYKNDRTDVDAVWALDTNGPE